MMAADIWNPNDIRELSGGWSEDDEKEFFKNVKANKKVRAHFKYNDD